MVHRRHEPAHGVRQRLRFAYLDLDELDRVVDARTGWSTHPAPVWFRRRDYLDGTDRPLGDALGDLVEERTGRRPAGPVRMLTQLRTLGWLFNPLTTYYLFEPDGTTLATLVLEISNTPWHERFWYVLDAADVGPGPRPFAKAFHVSPFLPMDLTYQCRAPVPDDRLALRFELSSAAPGADAAPRVHRRADRSSGPARGTARHPRRGAGGDADRAGLGRHLRPRRRARGAARPLPPPSGAFRRQGCTLRRYRPI